MPVKAFSWGVIVSLDTLLEPLRGEESEIGLARNRPAHAADGIFNAAFLPRSVGVAEEGIDIERVKFVVPGELGAVVEGDGLAQGLRQGCEQASDHLGDRT